MVKVFISYRRADTDLITDRIYKRLTRHFGVGRIFRDVYSISPGADFRQALEEAVGQCDVFLAVIGSGWMGTAGEGERGRLHDETDYVRREIEWGLGRNIRVIPLLIDGAQMPGTADLPSELEELAFHHAVPVGSGSSFESDLEHLIGKLGEESDVIYPALPAGFAQGDGLFVRILASVFPWAHWKMVQKGWMSQPPELTTVHNYLKFFETEMDKLNQVVQYVPLDGAERPGTPPPEAEYAPPQSRTEVLRAIRRTVRLLSGLSYGGNQATAQLASLNRTSRVVRDVARLLRRRNEPVILLGDPGSGKSTTIREVGRQLAITGRKRVQPPVVIYVPLGKYRSARGEQPGTVWALIKKQILKEHYSLLDLLPFLERRGRLVILFDGMDEMERRLYGARVTLLSDFARHHHGTIKTLFACRTNDFSPKFIHRQLILLEFDEQQVRDYLVKNLQPLPIRIDDEVFEVERLARHLLGNSELNETARNPLTLYLLCHFLRDKHTWPHTRRELFEHYLDALFNRLRDGAGKRLPESEHPSILDGWSRVAFHITIRHAGTSIKLDELRDEWGDDAAIATTHTGIRCGLLMPDESDELTIRFAHHRLQEYLTAAFLDKYGTEHDGIDWSSLVDTPRWQEILINLASIQQERSEALQVVLESMQSLMYLPARANVGLGGGGGLRRWSWPVEGERSLADRVVLASRIIRELGENPAKLPPRFLETFSASVARLAERGRPTTQVKMLWAWGNTANVCPLEALDAPLQSDVDWVRGQALSVVAGLSHARTRVDVDLRRELVIDLTNDRLLRRLRAYREAIIKTGDPTLYLDLSWAVACELVYIGGLFGLTCAVYFTVLTLWSVTERVEPLLPGLGDGGLAVMLSGISVSVAMLVRRYAGMGLWRLMSYVSMAMCAILYLINHIGVGATGSFFWSLVEAAMRAGIVLGALALGGQLVFWLKFGLHMLPGLLRDDATRRTTAYHVARKNSLFDAERPHIKVFVAAAALFVFVWLARLGYGLLEAYVLQPAQAYIDSLFASSPWPGRLSTLLAILITLVCIVFRFRSAPGRWRDRLRQWWARGGLSAKGSWRGVGVGLAKEAGIKLLAVIRTLPRRALEVLGAALFVAACLLVMFLIALVLVGILKALEAMGVNTDSSLLKPFLILLIVTSLLPLGLWKLLQPVLLPLRHRLTEQLRQRHLLRMTVNEWTRRVREAGPEEQFWFLSQTHYHMLGIEPDEFLRVLESLEEHIVSEPAASQYWKTCDALDAISRQERLANIAGLVGETPAAHNPPTVADGDTTQTSIMPEREAPARVIKPPERRPIRRFRTLRWVISALLIIITAGALLNVYVERHRVIYVVNGLPEQVKVEIDGEVFSMETGTFERRLVAEGTHTVTYRRGREASRSQEFTLVSERFHQRFLDDRVHVVNLEGAAILRYSFGFQSYKDVRVPFKPFYSVGENFVSLPRADYLFREVQATRRGFVSANELLFSPDLPSSVFKALPPIYSDNQKLALAEEHLRKAPANVLLLDTLEDFAVDRGHAQRYLDFLAAQIKQRPLPLEWYRRWQDLMLLTEGSEVAPQVQQQLETLLGSTPQNRSALLYLNARRQETLTAQLGYYDEAIRVDPRNAHAWFGKCAALKNRGEFQPAREACLKSCDLYREAVKRDIESESGVVNVVSLLAERLRWDDFFEKASLETLDLDLALRDYEAGTTHLQTSFDELTNKHSVHIYALALDVLLDNPYHARKRQGEYSAESPENGVRSGLLLHYMLKEFDEYLRKAGEDSEAEYRALIQAHAYVELGNYTEAERHFEALSPATRGYYSLLLSVGLGVGEERQPNRFWQRATEEFRQYKRPAYTTVAGMLTSDSAPSLPNIIDVDLPPDEKALVLLALAQRFPELRQEALAMSEKFAYTSFAPGHFLRRITQTMKQTYTGMNNPSGHVGGSR